MVILEAMSMRMPVIASDVDGPCEIIVPKITGFLFRAGHAEELADRIGRFLEDPGLITAMGANGEAAVRRWGLTERGSAERHRALYAELLAEPTAAKEDA
jgi:glycosyltransferase involved in cell wall biosynthesis